MVVRNARGYVWDREGCRLLETVDEVGTSAVRVVASPDGSRVAFLSGGVARIVAIPSGDELLQLEHPGEITNLAFDGDGETIVTGSRDRIGRVWSGNTGRLRRLLRGHRGDVLDVAVDPEGAIAATVSTDGTGRTWDVPSGTVAAVLFGHTNFVDAVDFSPDGQSIATASLDGTARTYRINGRPLGGARRPLRRGPRGPLLARRRHGREWRRGRHRPDLGGRCPQRAPARKGRCAPERPRERGVEPRRRRDGDDRRPADRGRARRRDDEELEGHERGRQRRVLARRTEARQREPRPRRDPLGRRLGQALRCCAPLRAGLRRAVQPRRALDRDRRAEVGRALEGIDRRAGRLLEGAPGPYAAVAFTPDSRTIVALTEQGVVSRYRCRVCDGIPGLLELAEERLAATGRELTPQERELYLRLARSPAVPGRQKAGGAGSGSGARIANALRSRP